MTLRLYDTMRRAKVDFAPHDPDRVTMYVCGPTVYGRAHIGNARPAVVFDVLARLLRHTYGADHVVYARNITDIDDKIIAAAAAEGVDPAVVTRRFTDFYHADMAALGVARPDLEPRATDHVEPLVHADGRVTGMIPMIAGLIDGGKAYAAEGHVLFDVSADPTYGALSRRPMEAMVAGARVEVAPYKRNPADFVLWKPSTPDQPGWDSPWGRGRPGWHIECSAMIEAHLGTTVDIHGGGLDLIFPHHENELAQSRCAHDGAPLAQVWMHNGFLSMGDTKMSKSLGNVVGVDELLAAGWRGETIRLALLTANYRQPLIWSEQLLAQTKATLDSWYEVRRMLTTLGKRSVAASVVDALCDDLNTPEAVARVSGFASEALRERQLCREALRSGNERLGRVTKRLAWYHARQMLGSAQFLGFLNESSAAWRTGVFLRSSSPFAAKSKQPLNSELSRRSILQRIEMRTNARARRDFAESDRIRDELASQGIVLEDGPGGTTWRRA